MTAHESKTRRMSASSTIGCGDLVTSLPRSVSTTRSSFRSLTIANQATADPAGDIAGTALVRTRDGRRARSLPLGTVSHHTPAGPCSQVLAAVGGRVMLLDPTKPATRNRGAGPLRASLT